MITVNRLLICLVVSIIVAAAGRVWTLSRYYRTRDVRLNAPAETRELRRQLFLGSDHRVDHFIAVPDRSRSSDETLPPSWKIAWITTSGDAATGSNAAIHGTAILRNRADELIAVDVLTLLPDSPEQAIANPQWLDELDFSAIKNLPSQPLGHFEVSIGVWDASAEVYITAGPDGAPGIAGVDDDGSGEIDDLRELGATGSDDFVVAPGQDGFEAAKSGRIVARLISRGAVVDAPPGETLTIGTEINGQSGEIWLDFDRTSPDRRRQILLRLR